MQKISTIEKIGENVFQGQPTIGLDLGDRSSSYCVLDEAGKILLEQKLPTTPEAMKKTFGRMPRSRIAMETGTHSPWVSRLLTAREPYTAPMTDDIVARQNVTVSVIARETAKSP